MIGDGLVRFTIPTPVVERKKGVVAANCCNT